MWQRLGVAYCILEKFPNIARLAAGWATIMLTWLESSYSQTKVLELQTADLLMGRHNMKNPMDYD